MKRGEFLQRMSDNILGLAVRPQLSQLARFVLLEHRGERPVLSAVCSDWLYV